MYLDFPNKLDKNYGTFMNHVCKYISKNFFFSYSVSLREVVIFSNELYYNKILINKRELT